MATILEELNAAARNLPELYQPIFGHEVSGAKPTRNCFDRLPYIKKIFDALTKELNRPLRVLDLGCNLGFFSFHAAEWGGVVTGIDLDERNIRVCKILAIEHPNYKIKFITAKVEEFIPTVKADEYDLVFCFNVLHWITPKFGFPFVQNLLKNLAEKIPTGLFELTTKSEFPNNNLPVNYRDFLQGYSFIRALAYPVWNDTKKVKRPFLFASRDYVHFEDLGLMKIDKISYSTFKPQWITYYHCGDKFVKCNCAFNKEQFDKAQREIQFLKAFGGQNGLPKLYTVLEENDEAGIRFFVAREKLEGIALSEKIESNEDFDRWDVIKQILQWMIFLEKHGYYQSDLHTGNFIYSAAGKVRLIDYEWVSKNPKTFYWPYNIKMLFFEFMNSILEPSFDKVRRLDYHTSGKMLSEFRKHISEYQYRQILELKDSADFFERLYEILFPSEKKELHTMAELEILEIEKYLDELGINVQAHTDKLNQLTAFVIMQQRRIEQLEKIIREKLK